jgi:predicted  nucleic acid-binding Zn-ribbon protein
MSNDQMSTKPTLETVLERMNVWGEQFRGEFAEIKSSQAELRGTVEELRNGQEGLSKGQDELRKGQDELRKGQEEVRADLHANLHLVARKIQALNDNILTIQANMRDLVVYIERLESGSVAPN